MAERCARPCRQARPPDSCTLLLRRERTCETFARLARAAEKEPPRVRALLGAFGQELGTDPAPLKRLKSSLNPLSRFDFGELRDELRHASDWQA